MGIYGHFWALHGILLIRYGDRLVDKLSELSDLDLDVQIAEEMERILTKYLVWVGLNNMSQRQSRF